MVMNIIADLKSTGAVNDAVLTKCLIDSGDLKIVWDGITPVLSGEPTADRILIALHKGGKIDAVKLIGETIGNLKSSIDSASMSNRDKVKKIDEAIEYLKVIRGIIADGEDADPFPAAIALEDAYDEPSTHAITVLG